MSERSKFFKYFREYEWSNVYAMIKNGRKDPLICEEDFSGKLVVITGATSGIGKVVAHKYASKGASILCINRNEEKSELLANEIRTEYNVECDYFLADLSLLKDSFEISQKLIELDRNIDVLIHNAGVHLTRKEYTSEGFEKVFVVNYLSSFIINFQLKEKLKSQGNSRIILVNSEGHRFAAWGLKLDDLNWDRRRYSGLKSYGSAKLAQLLSMHKFNEYFEGSGVSIIAMHPGAVKSESGKDNGVLYKWYKKNILDRTLKPASVAAEAIYYLGVSDEVVGLSGKFFNLTTLEDPAPPAMDLEEADKLWDKSLELTKVQENAN